jgi:multidrug efflux pump subunit AcrB
MLIQMGKMIALAVLFVYLVMVAQFQSLLAPFIVLFTMPLAFTGGMIGLLIAGEQLSMMSMVGFLVLVGVIVNNGIVFVDYVNQLRLGGLERRNALVATGRTRMRPILMTALTTIFAMTMMIFSQDTGSQMGRGMAIVVVGGLVYGTLMTLFVVPVIYDLLFRREVTQVDVGDNDLDEIPQDAEEFIAQYQKKQTM